MKTDPYRAVVIATPLEQARIDFVGMLLPKIPERVYQDTVTTIVRARLRASYFNVTEVPQGEASPPHLSSARRSPFKNGVCWCSVSLKYLPLLSSTVDVQMENRVKRTRPVEGPLLS